MGRNSRLLPGGAIIFWLLVAAAGTGCGRAAAPRVLDRSGYLIRHIELEGVQRFSKGQLLRHLHVGETRRMPFTPDFPFDPAVAAASARRIEELYAAYGYHRAAAAVLTRFDEDARRADLIFRVDEGPLTRVHELRFVWPPGPGELDDQGRRQVEAQAALARSGPFEVTRINDSVGAMRLQLQQMGFPLAQVTARSTVDEAAASAEVELGVEPGPRATVGEVRFEGLVGVPEHLVQREVEFALGKTWSPALVRQVENAAKAMRVFRWVAAVPPTQVERGRTPIVVRVSEAAPASIALGAELSFEAIRWQQQATAVFTHTNLSAT